LTGKARSGAVRRAGAGGAVVTAETFFRGVPLVPAPPLRPGGKERSGARAGIRWDGSAGRSGART